MRDLRSGMDAEGDHGCAVLHHDVVPCCLSIKGYIFIIGLPGDVHYQAISDFVVSVSLTRVSAVWMQDASRHALALEA
jgi:hypothetical protein